VNLTPLIYSNQREDVLLKSTRALEGDFLRPDGGSLAPAFSPGERIRRTGVARVEPLNLRRHPLTLTISPKGARESEARARAGRLMGREELRRASLLPARSESYPLWLDFVGTIQPCEVANSAKSGSGESPLPGGEGWGEGERLTIFRQHRSHSGHRLFQQHARKSAPILRLQMERTYVRCYNSREGAIPFHSQSLGK
jgi:hypothetical protein